MNPDLVYLAQTDTTAGFLSQNASALSHAKGRSPQQPFLRCTDSFREQKRFARTPRHFRKFLRRSRKTTFIYANHEAIRVVREGVHHRFLKRFGWLYSTSANRHGERFESTYAMKKADIIVEDGRGFFEGEPSSIYRIGRRRKRRVR